MSVKSKVKRCNKKIDITIRKLIKLAIIYLAVLSTLGLFIVSAENEALKDKINLIEQDRTELIKENKDLKKRNLSLIEENLSLGLEK